MTKIYNPISETENGKIPKKRPMDETKSGLMVEAAPSENYELSRLEKRAMKLMANKRIEKISLCKVGRFIINPFR